MSNSYLRLAVGTPIPAFALFNQNGILYTQQDLLGKATVLYFYPKDDTPICTIQACALRDQQLNFAARNIQIIGISCDTATAHQRFIAKYQLNFQLLCDPQNQVAQQWGLLSTIPFLSRLLNRLYRTTLIVDATGTVIWMEKTIFVKIHLKRLKRVLQQVKISTANV